MTTISKLRYLCKIGNIKEEIIHNVITGTEAIDKTPWANYFKYMAQHLSKQSIDFDNIKRVFVILTHTNENLDDCVYCTLDTRYDYDEKCKNCNISKYAKQNINKCPVTSNLHIYEPTNNGTKISRPKEEYQISFPGGGRSKFTNEEIITAGFREMYEETKVLITQEGLIGDPIVFSVNNITVGIYCRASDELAEKLTSVSGVRKILFNKKFNREIVPEQYGAKWMKINDIIIQANQDKFTDGSYISMFDGFKNRQRKIMKEIVLKMSNGIEEIKKNQNDIDEIKKIIKMNKIRCESHLSYKN